MKGIDICIQSIVEAAIFFIPEKNLPIYWVYPDCDMDYASKKRGYTKITGTDIGGKRAVGMREVIAAQRKGGRNFVQGSANTWCYS